MNLQESFERGLFVAFFRNEGVVILHFQHDILMEEMLENIKETLKNTKITLGIIVVDEKKAILSLTELSSGKEYFSNELVYEIDSLREFQKKVYKKSRIRFFTNTVTIQGIGFPDSKWISQQENAPELLGYTITDKRGIL
jgi:hypothetical protein